MNILLFGTSNVGKSVTGQLLASRLNYKFYDLDEEVKKELGITIEIFVALGTLEQRDAVRCAIINERVSEPTDKVIAVTPLSHISEIQHLFTDKNVLAIELRDTVKNIFDRLVFSDENDVIYKDDEYKNAHKDYYLRDIQEDIRWYGAIYSPIKNKFDMDGKSPTDVVDALIKKYHLSPSK